MKLKKVKILGIGSCAVSCLKEAILINQDPNLIKKYKIIFDQDYIITPLFNTISNNFDEAKSPLPPKKGLKCIEHVEEYNLCIIELFPNPPLWFDKKNSISEPSELFPKALQNNGFDFEINNYSNHTCYVNPETYINNLSEFIEYIQKKNKSISIILFNGELLYDQSGNPINSPLKHQIVEKLKSIDLTFLDINNIVSDLSERHSCFFETEFPYFFIQHHPDLTPTTVSRDCQNASPFLFQCVGLSFCNFFLEMDSSLPVEQTLSNNYEKRALTFLEIHHEKNKLNPQYLDILFNDSRKLSLYTGYVIATQNGEGYKNLKEYIIAFSALICIQGESLVTYFHHIQTLTAYLFTTKEPLLTSLCLIGMNVLSLPEDTHKKYPTYVVLWLKNIYLAAREIIKCNKRVSPQPLSLLLEKLKEKKHLHSNKTISQLLVFKEIYPQSKTLCKPPRKSQKRLKRIGIFLPRSSTFYLSMFFGLKRGFEQLDVEVFGWTELLEEKTLLEFCRQFKPDLIFEMNRTRNQLPNLPKNIPHACWLVDLKGDVLSSIQYSDILYTFASFWPMGFIENPSDFTDWLPPGFDPQIYYTEKSKFLYDFSFIGHIPLPWNQRELKRPLYPNDKDSKIFADFVQEYDRLWNTSIKQPTPPESLHSLMGQYQLLEQENQEIDIEDPTLRYDIIIRSRRMNIRKLVIDKVLPVSELIAIFGPENWKYWPKYHKLYHRFVENPHHLRKIYQSSRINIHEGVGLHMRSMDCFASGGCLIHIKADERNLTGEGLKFWFEKNIHYIALDKEDFSYQLKHVLADEKNLLQIGQEAAKLTHEKHSWEQRARKIIQDYAFIKS